MAVSDKKFKQHSIETLRSRVIVERDRVTSTASTDYPHNYPGLDLSWNLEKFKENFKLKINRLSKTEMEFDMIGVDAAIANAFRRILIAEVPTMAIANVYVQNNTSIIVDEVLAHRLGLIPILADPTRFEFRGDSTPTDMNTIVFSLKVKCTPKLNVRPGETDPNKLYNHATVYSGDLKWEPKGDQAERFKNNPIRPVHDDIVIAKLRPGQELDLEVHCEKGIGQDHAKWSPVCTASYRLLPEILVNGEITGDEADKFQSCFPKGVVDVVVDEDGVKRALVVNPRKDTMSREVLRYPEFENRVKLLRVRDHFIFTIESAGQIEPHVLLVQAVQVLQEKCAMVKRILQTNLQLE